MANLKQLEANYQATLKQQQPQQPAKKSTGLLGSIAHSLVAAPEYFANAAIVNPIKELSAQATGNQKALRNAVAGSNENLGVTKDGKKQGVATGVKKLAGNTVGLATTILAPEAKAGIAARAVQGAKIGATAGAGGALANDGSAEDTVKGALTGGLFGGILGGGAGAVSKGTSKVADLSENRAVTKAEKVVNDKKVVNETPFANVPKKVLQGNDLQGTLQHMQSLGIEPNVQNLKSFSNLVTGENGIVSGTVRQLLGKVGNVSTAGVLDDTKDALMKEAGQLGNVEDKGAAAGVLRSVRNTIQGTAYKGKGSLSDSADANDAFDAVRNLEKRVQDLGGTRATGTNGAEARVLQTAASSLKEKIGNEADATVKAHTLGDDDVTAIRDAVSKAGGGDDVADHIINGINKAGSLNELRGIQKPFVNASELVGAAEKAGGGALTKPIKEDDKLMRNVSQVSTNLALGNHFGIAQDAGRAVTESGVFDKILGAAGKGAESVKAAGEAVPGSFMNRLIATGGRAAGMSAPTTDAPQTDVAGTGAQLQADVAANQTPAADQAPTEPTIDKQTLLGLIAADPKNASTYISLYTLFNKDSTTNSTQQKATAAAKNAQNTLTQISNSFASAGGGQGKVGGTVANIEGKLGLNSNAATYNDTATALAASLYKALGNTGTISDRDQQLIANLIPKTTDTDTTAKAKIDQLESLLQQAEQNTVTT